MKLQLICLIFFLVFSSCGPSRSIQQPPIDECAENLNNLGIIEVPFPDYDEKFRTLNNFIVEKIELKNGLTMSARSQSGLFEHSMTIVDLRDEGVNKLRNEVIANDSTKYDFNKWYKLSYEEKGQSLKFANAVVSRKINDSTFKKGLAAFDVYHLEEENKLLIIQAIDFCKTSSSNHIEKYFQLNSPRFKK